MNDETNYTYSCCPDTIDGLTPSGLAEVWNLFKNRIIYCLNCGRPYLLTDKGLIDKRNTHTTLTIDQIIHMRESKSEHFHHMETCGECRANFEGRKNTEAIVDLEMARKATCSVCKDFIFKDFSDSQVMDALEKYEDSVPEELKEIVRKVPKDKRFKMMQDSTQSVCIACSKAFVEHSKTAKYN